MIHGVGQVWRLCTSYVGVCVCVLKMEMCAEVCRIACQKNACWGARFTTGTKNEIMKNYE